MDRVLAFGCHPDDLEFMAAGTLALLAKNGFEIHLATMTGGEVGHPTFSSQQIREIRLKEAEASARSLGGFYHWAGGHDLEVEYSADYRRMATRVMREVDPLIVFTHPTMDYLIDHEETSRLVRNAAYIASVPNYDCGSPTRITTRFPYLYYWNAVSLKDIFGRPLPLHFGIDIASVLDAKETALACHASQRQWLSHHNGWDAYLKMMKDWSTKEGERINRPAGECFIQHLGNGHPQDNVLEEVLKEYFVPLNAAS